MSIIQLKHTETKHYDALLYNLPEDQIPFTALPSETFERLKLRTDGHAKGGFKLLMQRLSKNSKKNDYLIC